MEIFINGDTREVDPDSSLISVLTLLELEQKPRIAVAVNDSVIPRSGWQSTIISQNDRILIITPAQGG